jgi:2-aminoethylphosphonate-pyruvate transaminase
VRKAALQADLCHREPEYLHVQARVIAALTAVYGCDAAEWRAVLHGGSGTSAMEAMLTSLLPSDGCLLVLENGVYGERLARIAAIYDIDCVSLRAPWGAPIDLAAIQAQLAGGEFTHLAVVHHETTTGRLNPLDEIADLCSANGVRLLVDAVSSFGAERIPIEHEALDACAGTANKCLHGIPGVAFVLCREPTLRSGMRRTLSLHLPDWAEKQRAGSTPYTPAVNAVLALQQALIELEAQGGWRARRSRYRILAETLRADLEELGVTPWLPAAESSCALRSYRLPGGLDYNSVHAALKDDGFVIYEGQGGLAKEMFRVSTMGDITDADLDRLLTALARVFTG